MAEYTTIDPLTSKAVDFQTAAEAYYSIALEKVKDVVSALPDDIRPGPDLYGMPWEPVIFSGLVGLMTMLLFTCRCYSSMKSRMYRSKERWMAEQVAQMLNEKCKVLETLGKCQQEHEELESSLRDSGVLAQTQKTIDLESEITALGHVKEELKRDLEQLKDELEQQREYRREQESRIAALEESMKNFDEETKDLQLQNEQAQTTLKVYNMNSDRLQRNLETAREENTLLQESNAQLGQQVEGWAERVSELEEEMSRCKVTHGMMQQDVANKDECIMSLTDQLLRIKAWDSDLEEEPSNGTTERGAKNGREDKVDKQGHLQKVQKLIYAAKLNADLKSVDEDKDRVFAKLNDEVKAKEDLLVSIKEMENEKSSLQSDTESYSSQVQRLQQKLQIMTEMYQENELKLHRLLTVEEKERLQKEEKLNKADRNIALAMEELNNYRQRATEMEEELEKTKQSYQTQISAHEKKAHNNWLAARAADRELADIRRENALLRQKMTDTQFKIDALDKDPFALDNLARPLPFRAERSLYGPSPLGRPGSETRPFLSPPTLVDGPPAARLSPRVPRGPGELLGGQGEIERSGGPHSDSGSNSPTWDRDRRGPPPGPPPPGYLFPEPGGPMFRRPPPPPGALGYLPPPGSLPPPPGSLHPRNLPSGLVDGSFRDNSLGPELDYRESGERRTPPDAEPRVGGVPPPGPVMGPMDLRRGPYGPPPPDFYPPRGPGGLPMMPMWAPPPPGVIFPPRFPPGGPPSLPPPPHVASAVRQPPTSIRGPAPSSADPPFPSTQPGATGAHTPT